MHMAEMRYTEDHEWVRMESDGTVTIGITDHAQDALGDIVFVEMPDTGRHFIKGEAACVVESVKAAADLKMPLAGTIVAVNGALPDDPSKVNTDPLTDGWFVRAQPDEPSDLDLLLDEAAYAALTAS
jgi:glycine cleavage system H protein